MDQAQHFTGKASAATSGGDHVSAEFRAGLEASERECVSYLPRIPSLAYPISSSVRSGTRECETGQGLVRIER